jgi:hypothetical protein
MISTDCSWRTYTIAFALHPDLLECNLVFGVDMDALEDFTVCTGTNDGLIAWFSVVYRLRSRKVGRQCWSLLDYRPLDHDGFWHNGRRWSAVGTGVRTIVESIVNARVKPAVVRSPRWVWLSVVTIIAYISWISHVSGASQIPRVT